MWIEKSSHTLAKLTGSCNQGDRFATQLSIAYGTFDNTVIPREMHVSVIQNKNLQGRKIQDKIMYESRISFTEAAGRQQKKNKDEYLEVYGEMMVAELPYEPDYWKQFPAKSEMNFAEGAPLPIFRHEDDPEMQRIRISTLNCQRQMKKEITSLSWGKIQPNHE